MSDALRIAEAIDYPSVHLGRVAAAELRRLHQFEVAENQWQEKTKWVQETAQPGELGMHRADVLKQRINRLNAENEALREANEAFGKRQEWWNDKMVALEALNTELVEALRMSRDALNQMWQSDKARPALVVAERALAKAGESK